MTNILGNCAECGEMKPCERTPIKPTQADLEAAAEYVSKAFGEIYRKSVLNEGRWPDLVQAFARHRLASLPAPDVSEERAREFADWLKTYVGQQDASTMRFSIAEMEIAYRASAQ